MTILRFLGISDLLMGFFLAVTASPEIHAVYMMLFYLALLLLTLSPATAGQSRAVRDGSGRQDGAEE